MEQRLEVKSFTPQTINKSFQVVDQAILKLLSEADRKVGELNAYSKLVPNVDFFIHMHVKKEAVKSGRIEGTQTELAEALMEEEEVQPEKRHDWREVYNYTLAMNFAINELNKLPLSVRLLNETHKIMLAEVRGENKFPGEIRRTQNWIGGSNLKNAFFVPPTPDELPNLLSDFEKFLHNDLLEIPLIIKAALAHYQFETIHPYCDGNGRLGRLLITLFFVEKNLLTKPTLYLSDFFERNKSSYYDALTSVRNSNNIGHWIKFFLSGVIETADSSINTFSRIIELREKYEKSIYNIGKRAKIANHLLNYLYSVPIVTSKKVSSELDITHPSANSLIQEFINLGILKEITGFKRNRLFVFDEYIKVFK